MAPVRRYKRESTVAGGLLTPDESFASHLLVDPKRESVDLTSIDELQGAIQLSSNLKKSMAEGSQGTLADRHRRSEAMSASTHTHESNDFSNSYNQNGVRIPAGDQGLQLIGRDVNRLVNLIEQLRRIGLQSIEGALPELVLCGDQSAGKSSLMGAIAEINLPKGQSMCTRCPTHIETRTASDWSCTVSLQEDHTYEPTRKKGQAFPNWASRPNMSSHLFKKISNKSELEEVLTWAQIALLNPSKDYKSFVPGTPEHALKQQHNDTSTEAQFSPNVIAVTISGPNLPALSFYDLPGLFQAAEDAKQEFLIKVFEDITIKYIKHPNAIIICTITMQNDPGLSRTKALITKYKAENKCIGVLTMPDRLQSDSAHKDYDNIFRQKTYRLPRGYFVTKQPGPSSRIPAGDSYHALAREEEDEYFDNSPWGPGQVWSDFRDRCGTGTIQKYLSKEFAKLILASVPDLTDKINAQTREVEEALALLPETPNDKVQYTVRKHLSVFSNDVQRILDGSSQNNKFHSDWTKLCRQFLKAVECMRPGCVTSHPSDIVREVINIDDSDTESIASQRTSSFNGFKRTHDGGETPTNKRPRINDQGIPLNMGGSPHTPNRVKVETAFTTPSMPAPPIASATARKLKDDEIGPFYQRYLDSGVRAMTIGDIKEAIEANSRAGIPGHVSSKVMEDYALQAIHPWSEPLETFIGRTFEMLRDQVLSCLSTALREHRHTALYNESVLHITEFLEKYERQQRTNLFDIYDVERLRLFTINDEDFNRHKAEALNVLKLHRRARRVACYTETHFRGKGNGDSERDSAAKEKFKKDLTDEMLGRDPFERELDVAAYIRGYYTTARLRFTDSVCANMHTKYFRKISDGINYFLEQKFGLDRGDGETICVNLLEGSAEISQKRAQLHSRKAQLIEFARTLDQLRYDTFADDGARREAGSERNYNATVQSASESMSMSVHEEDEIADDNVTSTTDHSQLSRHL